MLTGLLPLHMYRVLRQTTWRQPDAADKTYTHEGCTDTATTNMNGNTLAAEHTSNYAVGDDRQKLRWDLGKNACYVG